MIVETSEMSRASTNRKLISEATNGDDLRSAFWPPFVIMSEATKNNSPGDDAKDKKAVKKEELVRIRRQNGRCSYTFTSNVLRRRFWSNAGVNRIRLPLFGLP